MQYILYRIDMNIYASIPFRGKQQKGTKKEEVTKVIGGKR